MIASRLRALLRLVAIAAFVVVMYSWLLVSSFLLALVNLVRGRGFWSSTDVWRSDIFHNWSAFVLPLFGVRLSVRGSPPEAPFILVSNHLSYLDILVLAGQLRAVFIAKSEVRGWPLLGALCRLVDTHFIERERKSDLLRVLDRIGHVLDTGRGVVFFPEGTTSNGEDVQRFRPSLLEVPASAGRPVSWAAITYRTPPGTLPAGDAVCWWGGADFLGHFLPLLGLPYVEAHLSFGDTVIREKDRKQLALKLHQAISEDFVPVV